MQDIKQIQTVTPILNLDKHPSLFKENEIKFALNAQVEGFNSDGYYITNSYSNELCFEYPFGYELKGYLKLDKDEYVIFFNFGAFGIIGILDTSTCKFTEKVRSKCLHFENDVKAVWKYISICESRRIYFVDGKSPDRYFDIDIDYPKKIKKRSTVPCVEDTYTDELDCDKLNFTKGLKYPCIDYKLSSGTLLNGSYQAAIRYTDNKSVITESYIQSNIKLYNKNNSNGLEVQFTDLDQDYNQFELLLIAQTKTGRNVYSCGYFSTKVKSHSITSIDNYPQVDFQELLFVNTIYDTSKHITSNGDNLIRTSLNEKIKINYQHQANKIKSNWVLKRVKATSNEPTFNHDEIYSFYIEWIHKNGSVTCLFHIPNNTPNINNSIVSNNDVFEKDNVCEDKTLPLYYQIYNTASVTSTYEFDCNNTCEQIVARGEFGQFDSEERYPDESYVYKNETFQTFGELACNKIKLHKFPDNCLLPLSYSCDCNGEEFIDILGVEFNVIEHPKDLDGNYIEDIVGYRIYRADSTGNNTIMAKGLLYNMAVDDSDEDDIKYFPNFPLNDLTPNQFLSKTQTSNNFSGTGEKDFDPLTEYSKKLYTFLSPEYSYVEPSYGNELKLYGENIGCISSSIKETYNHPEYQLLTNGAYLLATGLGIALGAFEFGAKKCTEVTTQNDSKITGEIVGPAGGILSDTAGTVQTDFIPSVVSATFENGTFTILVDTECRVSITSTDLDAQALLLSTGITLSATPGPGGLIQRSVPLVLTVLESRFNPGSFNVICTDPLCCIPLSGLTIKHGVETTVTVCGGISDKIPNIPIVSTFLNLQSSIFYALQGSKTVIDGFKAFLPYYNYAKQVNELVNYNQFDCGNIKINNSRRFIKNINDLKSIKQQLYGYKINNDQRETTTFIELDKEFEFPTNIDNSRFVSSDIDCKYNTECCTNDSKQAVSYYGAIKRSLKSPYGKLVNVNPISMGCYNYRDTDKEFDTFQFYRTDSLFNGDTYISKFSVKRKFPLFNFLPLGENRDYILDYRNIRNVAYPRFWVNTEPYEFQDLFQGGLDDLFQGDTLPNDRYNLDCEETKGFRKKGHFYTYVNAVVNFYVETKFNENWRVNNELSPNYPNMDKDELFKSDKWMYDNIYNYPFEMNVQSLNKPLCNFTDFEPDSCNKQEFKLVYSNNSFQEEATDNWLIYPPSNYTLLPKTSGPLTTVHAVDDYNLMIAFEDGIYVTQQDESILTKSGNEIFIGSGDIFSRRLKKLADDETGYLGSVDEKSFINTRHGTFWVDRKRKKILKYDGKVSEVSMLGINQWLQNFLDDKHPDQKSVIAMYDNRFDTIYFTHKRLSEECSWTLSYKEGLGFISFHSFIPDNYFWMPNYFMSGVKDGIWKHNTPIRKDIKSYQTYYGKQYPYIITTIINNQHQPTILQSIDIKHETIKELDFNNLIYNNKIFFNKFNVYSEYTNSGLHELYLKNQNNMLDHLRYLPNVSNDSFANIRNYDSDIPNTQNNLSDNSIINPFSNTNSNIGIPVSHVETNTWRINKFKNLAVGVPHVKNLCDGHNFVLENINYKLNPYEQGLIRGDWFALTLINDKVFDHRFQTYIKLNLNDSIHR